MVTAFITISPGSTGATASTEPAASPDTFVDVALDAPTALDGTVELRLLLDGDDVTDSICDPSAAAPDTTPQPVWSCRDVPDGTYTVEAVGLPDGLLTSVQCIDALVGGPELDTFVVDRANARLAYSCTVFVGTPAIVLSVGAFGGPIPAGAELALPGVETIDGVVCSPAQVNVDHPATRCDGLPLGDYTPEIVGTSATDVVFCQPIFQAFSGGSELTGTASLTEANWLWSCNLEPPPPNAVVRVEGDIADANNFDGPFSVDVSAATPVVIGPDGDVGDQCRPGSFDAPYRVEYDCFLPPGMYTVEWANLPSGEFVADCTELVVIDATTVAECTLVWQRTSTTTDAPGDTLPATGNGDSGPLSKIAVTLLLAGALLVWTTRRPAATDT